MNMNEIRVGDLITSINGEPCPPEPVVEIHPSGTRVRLTDSWGGLQRWLYNDQHQVTIADHASQALMIRANDVGAESVLPPEAYAIISDSLLWMAETLEDNGKTSVQTRAVLKALHRFSSPSTETEVVIRPKAV